VPGFDGVAPVGRARPGWVEFSFDGLLPAFDAMIDMAQVTGESFLSHVGQAVATGGRDAPLEVSLDFVVWEALVTLRAVWHSVSGTTPAGVFIVGPNRCG
jgi:choline dehydrogenase-like flavoprotein